jgi:hypothetical protein
MQLQTAVIKQLWFVGYIALLACGIETVAQGREWYWYRVAVERVGENQYRDRDSGVTIMTRDCDEFPDAGPARLMVSATSLSGWIAFDGGASCDVTGLVRAADEDDAQEPSDTPDDDDSAPDEAIGMFA